MIMVWDELCKTIARRLNNTGIYWALQPVEETGQWRLMVDLPDLPSRKQIFIYAPAGDVDTLLLKLDVLL